MAVFPTVRLYFAKDLFERSEGEIARYAVITDATVTRNALLIITYSRIFCAQMSQLILLFFFSLYFD